MLDTNAGLLEYRVSKIEENEEKTIEILNEMNSKLYEVVTTQSLQEQRSKFNNGLIALVVTALANIALLVADKVFDYSESEKKDYYNQRIVDSDYVKILENRIKELEKDLK